MPPLCLPSRSVCRFLVSVNPVPPRSLRLEFSLFELSGELLCAVKNPIDGIVWWVQAIKFLGVGVPDPGPGGGLGVFSLLVPEIIFVYLC